MKIFYTKNTRKKKMCENEDIPDGRDETIKLLKEENEKLKKGTRRTKKEDTRRRARRTYAKIGFSEE